MYQAVKQFFDRHQQATAISDLTAIGSLYSDPFMFAGANGVKIVKKEDLLNAIPRMKAHFISLGLTKTQLHKVEASAIGANYLLAKTGWTITVVDSRNCARQINIFSTYVLEQKTDGSLSIVFQIDHQDLATVINEQRTA